MKNWKMNNTLRQIKIKLLMQSLHMSNPTLYPHVLSKPKTREELYKRQAIWRKKHRPQINRYRHDRMKTDSQYRLSNYLRSRIVCVLRKNTKLMSTIELLGCSLSELKKHLERQFTLGMNWKNYGFGWHIDHIKPCSKIDLSKQEEQRKCFHYTNLQPLWASENLKKGNKIALLN